MRRRMALAAVLCSIVGSAAIAAVGDQLTPGRVLDTELLGLEPGNSQAMAMGPDGQAIVVWKGQSNGSSVLYSQRFDAHGQPVGSALALNEAATLGAVVGVPQVTISGTNVASVVWQSATANDEGDIAFLQIDGNGQPIGIARRLNEDIEGGQSLPSIASDAWNHVTVTWTGPMSDGGYGVFAEAVNQGGQLSSPVRIDELSSQSPMPSIAVMRECCASVVVWLSDGSSIGSIDVTGTIVGVGVSSGEQTLRARRFGLGGSLRDPEVTVNQTTIRSETPIQFDAQMDLENRLTVAWVDRGVVSMQRLDAVLNFVGNTTPVVTTHQIPAESRLFLRLDNEAMGLLAWTDESSTPNQSFFQRFDENGAVGSSVDALSSEPSETKRVAGLGMDQDGDLGMVWTANQGANSPTPSLKFARFEGTSDVPASVFAHVDSLPSGPGQVFTMLVDIQNLSTPAASFPSANTLTGLRLEVNLDFSIRLNQLPDVPGWACVLSPSQRTLVCESTIVLAPGAIVVPIELYSTFYGFVATNEVLLTTLQGDSDLSDNAQTLVLPLGATGASSR